MVQTSSEEVRVGHDTIERNHVAREAITMQRCSDRKLEEKIIEEVPN